MVKTAVSEGKQPLEKITKRHGKFFIFLFRD